MSVEKTPNGRWKVRWRDPARRDENGKPRARSKTFTRKVDADKYDAKMTLAITNEDPLPVTGSVDLDMTFAELAKLWLAFRRPNWTGNTPKLNEGMVRLHLDPYLGEYVVRRITPQDILGLRPRLESDDCPSPTITQALVTCRRILAHGRVLGLRADNPADVIEAQGVKPNPKPKKLIVPLSPTAIEAIRTAMMSRPRSRWNLRDATFVSVMAYGGLRPEEARGLKWSDLADGRLAVVRALKADGSEGPTKGHGKSDRRIIPWGPLTEDLIQWRKVSMGKDGDYVFQTPSGKGWTKNYYDQWRGKRAWAKAAPEGTTPYVLRHSHASLRVRAGEDRQRIAHHMGHEVATLDKDYTHFFEDFAADPEPIDPVALIRLARGEEPQQPDASDLSNLSDEERDVILAHRAKVAAKTAEAADHDAETEAAWDEVAV